MVLFSNNTLITLDKFNGLENINKNSFIPDLNGMLNQNVSLIKKICYRWSIKN